MAVRRAGNGEYSPEMNGERGESKKHTPPLAQRYFKQDGGAHCWLLVVVGCLGDGWLFG